MCKRCLESESLYRNVIFDLTEWICIFDSQTFYAKNNPFHCLCMKFPTVNCLRGIFRLIRDFCHQNSRGQLANLIFGEENWFVRLKEPQTKRNQDNFLRNKPINYTFFFSLCLITTHLFARRWKFDHRWIFKAGKYSIQFGFALKAPRWKSLAPIFT